MEERQVKHFKFRQMRRTSTGLRIPNGVTGKYSLLCCANTYGMLFIGGNNSFVVCHTAMLYKVNDEDTDDRNRPVSLEQLKPVTVSLPGQPCYLGLSADELTLSVCLRESSLPCMLYDTRSFCEPHSQPLKPFAVINLAGATGSVQVSGLSWNPTQPECFAVCLSDGSVSVWENQGTSTKCCAKVACEATSICWSPKGKQLAVGHRDGRVSQYSSLMELKKEYAAPDLLTEKHQVAGLFWIATHQFALVLTPSNLPPSKDDDLPPPSHFMILTASKKKAPEYEDYDDIYYGMGNNEPHFLFSFLSTWNILITCSSTASESMVLSKQPGSEVAWEKWDLEDEGRAELPVDGTDDTFPCGMCLDVTSTVPIPYGENSEVPPSPLFVLLSDHGLLIPYMVFNVEPPPGTSYDFVKPPQTLNKTGERKAPSPSSVQGSAPLTTSNPQVSQPVSLTATANPALASKILLSETLMSSSSTFARSFSLDKKPLSFSLPPFSGGGSLPNLLAANNPPPLAALSKPQPVIAPLSQGVQRVPLSSSSNDVAVTTAAAAPAKTPPAPFKQPLLSSTPISVASQKVMGSAVSSTTAAVTTMPPPASRIVSSVQTPSSMPKTISVTSAMPVVSTVVPASVQKLVSSHSLPARPSAPSPAFSVTSSIEEENVEQGLVASIEQEIEEFSEQLQEHFDDVQEVFCGNMPDECCAIGSDEDQRRLVEEQEEMSTTVNSLLDQTKELASTVESMMDEILECRSLYEEANDAIRMRNSDHYREYIKMKPLTPLLQSLLNEVHSQYALAEARVRELSAQIDADVERRKELEAIRVGGTHPLLHTPTYHNIYTTLKNNRRITRLQSTNVDQLVQKMKNITILPRAWNFDTPSPATNLSSTSPDKSTRQSQALLNEVKSVVSPIKQIKKKQPLFKYSPERLSELQKLFESSGHSTSMQTIPLMTSFAHNSSTQSTCSTTPVLDDDDEDDEVTLNAAPHTPPTFSTTQLGELQQPQENYPTMNQPLQGSHFMSQQPSLLLQSSDQEAPGRHPLTSPPYGLPPLYQQTPLEFPQGSIKPPSQSHITSMPPPPPPSQPPPQDHVIHHGGSTSSGPTATMKTPSEMAAEAALKRQQSACGASTVTVQNTVVTTASVTKTPVVVITASEMPPSSLFFTGKSSQAANQPSATENTTKNVHQFMPPVLDHSSSIPANFQFNFSAQNPSMIMPPFFASTTGSQTSLTFGLSTSSDNKASLGSLFSKSETSFPKPASSTRPPESGLLSKSETSLFEAAVTTSGMKPSSLLFSLNSSTTGIHDTLTKPFSAQNKNSEETSGEESELSEDEQGVTLTKPPSATAATPILSLNSKSVVSSLSTASAPVGSIATPIIAATTVESSVTFSATTVTDTLSINKPSVVTVASSAALPTSIAAIITLPTSSVISSTTTLSSTIVSAAPPTLIADSLPTPSTTKSGISEISSVTTSTSAAPPTTKSTSMPITGSAAPPITESTILPITETTATPITASAATPIATSVAPPVTTSAASPVTTSVAPPVTTPAATLITTSAAPPITSAAPPVTTSVAPPVTTSVAPPVTTSAAPPIMTSAAPPVTTSAATPITTSAAPPIITSAAVTSTISVVPPTPSTTAPPTTTSSSFSIKTVEATTDSVTNPPPSLTVPLFRVSDKPSDSEGESDVIDNGLDRVASQSSSASNMTDEINIDDSEGEMDKEPATKETTLNQGFTSLFGERKTVTNSMASSNPFGSSGNVSDNGSSISTGLHSAHTPSVGSGSGLLAPSKFNQSSFVQSSGLGTGMGLGQTKWGLGQTGMGLGRIGMGVGQTGMGANQTGMGVGQTGMGVSQTGMGVGQTGMGVGQTGMGVGQTGMGVSQTGMGAGSNASVLGGTQFGASPLFAGQPQFGSRPVMGNVMGPTATTRVFGSSMESDQTTTFGSIATGGGFAGLASNQTVTIGTGIGGVAKSSFQGWR